ncbi:MAG: hypothetical protein ACE5J3_08980 [Methanosarcinales archaeon]
MVLQTGLLKSEKLLEALIPEIIESFNLSDLARVADNIYKVLSNKLELQLVCSNSGVATSDTLKPLYVKRHKKR